MSLFHVDDDERGACGTGFVALRGNVPSRQPLLDGLAALACLEHRGACLADQKTGDGAGIMTDIPFDLFNVKRGEVAVASIFVLGDSERRKRARQTLRATFTAMGVNIIDERAVPHEPRVLGRVALESMPEFVHIIFERPAHCRTASSFNTLLYLAKQKTRTRLKEASLERSLFFSSLSESTIVYKALSRAADLVEFYPDLQSSSYRTRFSLFHRRFSTNTRTTWDKAQPFRLIAHNGEINTITGNRSWSASREHALGLPRDELLTRTGTSDSGNLNEMVEALKHRSSIPYVEDALALIVPPAFPETSYTRFWSRACEPWDGPALITYCDGEAIGARIDRNGFRPCRYMMTDDAFYLASETGLFPVDDAAVLAKGTLAAGSGVKIVLGRKDIYFRDPSASGANRGATFDPRFIRLSTSTVEDAWSDDALNDARRVFGVDDEILDRFIAPMVVDGKEPISSMGDTAAPAILAKEPRSFFDYFYQGFAQVTNPPLDYLREALVTDLSVYLGRAPNIFAPKELLPPRPSILLDTPVLTLADRDALIQLGDGKGESPSLTSTMVDICFDRDGGPAAFRDALARIAADALRSVRDNYSIIILSDENASATRIPIPSLLALRAAIVALNREGLRLRASLVVDAGDAVAPHHVAALIGFGAHALIPRLALRLARSTAITKANEMTADERERNLVKSLSQGLLRVMAKMGISVARSFQSTKLFTPIGIGDDVLGHFFAGMKAPIGGLGLDEIAAFAIERVALSFHDDGLAGHNLLKEDARGLKGERHRMTARRSRQVHTLVARERVLAPVLDDADYAAYAKANDENGPTALRDLLDFKHAPVARRLDDVEPAANILRRFGAGAMSFGAISKDAQRDIFIALKNVGGRSNSGEGGENPWYFVDGTHASTKQVASGRFGVTAEYLVASDEIEIKVAQGAKPGEGGQLMGQKVGEEIARARNATPGTDLISPPPLHDIYSIEDLKGLIYELKETAPGRPVVVKLVSGASIGTIAVGVVKAGADIIQISGGDGGTGAAPISSMRHAGLPWELGLVEVHDALVESGLRHEVRVRVDGGLTTASDVVKAAMFGAEDFNFGKLLLVAEGCIMARVCEKNTCPRGIATHDPRFLAKYRGSSTDVERMLRVLADGVREHLSAIGVTSIDDVIGRADLLIEDPRFSTLRRARGLALSPLLRARPLLPNLARAFVHTPAPLNDAIAERVKLQANSTDDDVDDDDARTLSFDIRSTDRAAGARLMGALASKARDRRRDAMKSGRPCGKEISFLEDNRPLSLAFKGAAGQGFGAFTLTGVDITLEGDANDGVGKSMAGGTIVIRPSTRARFVAHEQVIIGNTALYGATGGTLILDGRAGDRFAVRNSGADAILDGAGLHACAYMTGGTVVILGPIGRNAAAGMTGGCLYIPRDMASSVNDGTVVVGDLTDVDVDAIANLLRHKSARTGSVRAKRLADNLPELSSTLVAVRPRVLRMNEDEAPPLVRAVPGVHAAP